MEKRFFACYISPQTKENPGNIMAQTTSKKKKPNWPGTPVTLAEMLVYLDKYTSPQRRNNNIHYMYSPRDGQERTSDTLCTMRLGWMDVHNSGICIEGYFDGAFGQHKLRDRDIIIGGYNGFNNISSDGDYSYQGFSIIFHLHHIRLHYGAVVNNKHHISIYYHTTQPASGTLQLMLEAMDRLIHEVDSPRKERCSALLNAIILQLRSELSDSDKRNFQQGKHTRLAIRIKNYLEQNFNRDIDCSQLSDALQINRSYASTVFRKEFNTTMKNYLITLRLNTAATLLNNKNNMKIGDIADICAFSSVSYFCKVFRKHYGISPNDYRNRADGM